MNLVVRIALSALTRPTTLSFGDDGSQRGELHLPGGSERLPVAVVLHGGHWQTRLSKLTCRPLARDLVRRGWAVWNLEYRRLGDGRGGGGGWPMTFDDVAAGIDHLADLAHPRLDLDRVVLVGHSAGGQLALWAAGRGALPGGAPGAVPRVEARAVVALAPVTALSHAGVHARSLLGGTPEAQPVRWAQADPSRSVPSVPVLVAHPAGDDTVPVARSVEYVDRCRAAGADVELASPAGETHRDPIDPSSETWRAAAAWLDALPQRPGGSQASRSSSSP